MDLATLLFWIIAIILVGSSLLVVGLRNIVHSALALVVVFAMAAGIYLLLNAEFIAIVQILIYAGAVTILILFALMLTRTNKYSLKYLLVSRPYFTEPIKWYAEIRDRSKAKETIAAPKEPELIPEPKVSWVTIMIVGLVAGVLAGMFGIGGEF